MKTDLYSFAFRGILAEEALDKAGHKKYFSEEAFFSEVLFTVGLSLLIMEKSVFRS